MSRNLVAELTVRELLRRNDEAEQNRADALELVLFVGSYSGNRIIGVRILRSSLRASIVLSRHLRDEMCKSGH